MNLFKQIYVAYADVKELKIDRFFIPVSVLEVLSSSTKNVWFNGCATQEKSIANFATIDFHSHLSTALICPSAYH